MRRRLVAGPTPGPSPRIQHGHLYSRRGESGLSIAFDRVLRLMSGFLRLPWRGLSGAPAPGRIVNVRLEGLLSFVHVIPCGC